MKRFVALGIASVQRYKADPFLRTEIHVILLQVLFSLLLLALVTLSFSVLYQTTLTYIVSDIQQQIFAGSIEQFGTTVVARDFQDVHRGDFVVLFIVGTFFMFLFGYLTVRLALAPVKGALASQKQFIGNIAHELRTPLSIIKWNTELELMDKSVPQKAKGIHRSNLEEVNHMSETINNLLTLNTLVTPGMIELSDVSMAEVIDRVMERLSPLAAQKEMSVTVEKSAENSVWGNMSALEQIATNIIKNAIAYTPRSGAVKISVLPDEGETVSLSVRDSGIGIEEKDLFRVFDPFYRTDASRTRRGGGSGLGLAIVSELVRLHHGRITIESAPKRGTTVTVFIPTERNTHALRPPHKKKTGEISIDFSKNKQGGGQR